MVDLETGLQRWYEADFVDDTLWLELLTVELTPIHLACTESGKYPVGKVRKLPGRAVLCIAEGWPEIHAVSIWGYPTIGLIYVQPIEPLVSLNYGDEIIFSWENPPITTVVYWSLQEAVGTSLGFKG